MENIPEYVKGNILPANNLNILEIISFATPPVTNPPSLLWRAHGPRQRLLDGIIKFLVKTSRENITWNFLPVNYQ